MFKQLYFFFMLLLAQLIAAGPAPNQPIGGDNPDFGRGGGDRRRDRWTWCRCRRDPWDDRRDDRDDRGGRRDL